MLAKRCLAQNGALAYWYASCSTTAGQPKNVAGSTGYRHKGADSAGGAESVMVNYVLMRICFTILFSLTFSCSMEAPARTYTTTFPVNQDPLSENGNWADGKTVGLLWSDCAVTNTPEGLHYAYGLESGANGYDDSLAVLTGDWGPTQSIDITIYLTNQLTSDYGVFQELEYGLRCTLSSNKFTGYLMDCSLNSDTGYVEVGLSLGDGVYPDGWTNWPGAGQYGPEFVVHNGSTIHAQIINSTISIYFDGVLVLRSTDTTGLGPTNGGGPAIGFYHTQAGYQTDFGISSFTATDGIDPPLVLLSPTVTNEQFSFSFQTEPGQSYYILQFTNLFTSDQGAYTRITGTGLPYKFSVPAASIPKTSFFRVMVP